MKLDELHIKIAKDFPIDNSDLGNEATKTTSLWVTYIKLWSDETLRLEKLQSGRNTLISTKREYYSGNASAAVYQANPFNGKTPKSDRGIQILIENDLDVIQYDEGLNVQKNKVQVLEAALDEWNRRGYGIKTAADVMRFMNGG